MSEDDLMRKEEKAVTEILQSMKTLANRLSLDLDSEEGADLMMKCMAVCMVSIGAQIGKDSFHLEGVVHGGNRERCDTYEFDFKSSLKHRHLAN